MCGSNNTYNSVGMPIISRKEVMEARGTVIAVAYLLKQIGIQTNTEPERC